MRCLDKFDKVQLRERQRKRNFKSMEELRRAKREGILLLKRKYEVFNVEQYLGDAALNPIAIRKMFDNIPVLVSDLMSVDKDLSFAATAKLSFLLSNENPPIQEVIRRGVVPRLVSFLKEQHGVRFQLYTVRALCAIASGTVEQANVVINLGAVPLFVEVLSSLECKDSKVCEDLEEQVVAVLHSLANRSPYHRDHVLYSGALTPLVAMLEKTSTKPSTLHEISMLQICCRTLATFCQGNPPPPFDHMRSALPILRRLVHINPPVGVLGRVCADACQSLSCLSNGSVDQIQAVIDADVCARLVTLLGLCSDNNVIEHVLRTVGNIFKGSDSLIQVLIDGGVCIRLNLILMHGYNSTILRKTCSVISTMTARGRNQIQKIMDSNVIRPLLRLSQGKNNDMGVQWDAACALSYAAQRGSNEQIRSLVNQGCIRPLCDFLICPDRKTSLVCLEGLKIILKAGEEEATNSSKNPYAQIISDFNGFGKIENLRTDPELGETAANLLEHYGGLN